MTSVKVYSLEDHDLKDPLRCFAKGDHVIGRGELKCNDKRVSRRHAIISTHTNPCFYKSSCGNSIETLSQDATKELHDGDMFALLADKFWFRIKLMSGNNRVDDERRLSKRIQNDNQETSNKRAKIDATSNSLDRPVDTEKFLENIQQIVREDYRNTLDESSNASNESVDLLDLMQARENECASNNSRNVTNNVETRNNEEEQTAVKTEPNLEVETIENNSQPTEDDAIKETGIAESCLKAEFVEIKTEPTEEEIVALKTEPESISVTVKEDQKIEHNPNIASSSSAAISSSTSDKPKAVRRDRCWYGASCYRKNPIHRQGFSHPGDPDYDSDPEDDRLSCPYGNACYRTSVEHRRQYKHSAKPAPKPSKVQLQLNIEGCPYCSHCSGRPHWKGDSDYESDTDSGPSVPRKARKCNTIQSSNCQDSDTATESEDDGQPAEKMQRRKRKVENNKNNFNETPEDDYDLEDPFIDDASSDAFEPSDDGDDSDWDEDVESADETEDVKRLVKEANRFTKKRVRKVTKGDQKLKEISSDEEDADKDLRKDHDGSD
nr:unnamed protein product [Callosobruchus analis]